MVYQQLSSKKPERGSDFNNGVLKKFQGNISKNSYMIFRKMTTKKKEQKVVFFFRFLCLFYIIMVLRSDWPNSVLKRSSLTVIEV